jgi:hypothetical protein
MTALSNCLLIVTAEVDAAVEADWNRWYDDVHLPDALACPGVLAGRRYVTSGEVSESDRGQGRRAKTKLYTTVYESASTLPGTPAISVIPSLKATVATGAASMPAGAVAFGCAHPAFGNATRPSSGAVAMPVTPPSPALSTVRRSVFLLVAIEAPSLAAHTSDKMPVLSPKLS